MKKTNPPKFGTWLLGKIFPDNSELTSVGDFEEVYYSIVEENGVGRAKLWYWFQILISAKSFIFGKLLWSSFMFQSYLKSAWRNMKVNRSYSLINILGLTIGITCCILIFLYVQYEMSFDSFHKKADRIYRMSSATKYPTGIEYAGDTPYPLATALRNDFPELEHVAQIYYEGSGLISVEKNQYRENRLVFAEPHFFKVFDYIWIAGDSQNALQSPNSVVLTESLALKYFGNKQAIGKTIKVGNRLDLNVTGVLKDPPYNSHLRFTMLISLKSYKDYNDRDFDRWSLTLLGSTTYVVLPEKYPPAKLINQFDNFKNKYMSPEDAQVTFFALQPLNNIHYEANYSSFYYTTSKSTILVISMIGFIILIIACINFVNLSTAQTIKRSKEVGLRKVLGAVRAQLIRQFISETILFTFLALLLSLGLVKIMLPEFNQFLGHDVQLSLKGGFSILFFLTCIYFAVSLFTGLYPALVLSRYQPIQALKNKITSRNGSSLSLRNGLVVIQFFVSQVLIICTIVIANQMEYFSHKDLGFEKENIVTVNVPEYDSGKLEVFRNKLLQYSKIKELSYGRGAPITNSFMRTGFSSQGSDVEYQVVFKPVDTFYADAYNLKLLSGRWFSPRVEDDTTYRYVVNETLINRIGCENLQDAVGQSITVSGMKGEILGVVKDFHMFSLHNEIMPIAFTDFFPQFYYQANINIHSDNYQKTLNTIEKEWKAVFPEYIFECENFSDYLNRLYNAEHRTFIIIKIFTTIAVLIGCLGLLGLVSFLVVQKTKEIGIRKVLGASVLDIVCMLTKDFTKWIILASVIAWPVAYLVMKNWLHDFAYRINLGPGVFFLSVAIALIFAIFTIGYQSIKAAQANPVDSLMYE